MAKILLIYPSPQDTSKQWRFGFSLNLLYLAALAAEAGHEIIDYLDFSAVEISDELLSQRVDEAEFVIVELDAFALKRSVNVQHGEDLILWIRSRFPQKYIIATGYDTCLFPRDIEGADFTFTDEAELSIAAVIESLPTGTVDRTRRILEDLDVLPHPMRGLLTDFVEHGGNRHQEAHLARSTMIQTSRGCLNHCSFCQRKGWSSQYRTHSPGYVINEFRTLEEAGYRNVWISDDNFTCRLQRAKEILDRLRRDGIAKDMRISLSSWVHIDEEFLRLAKLASVSIISFGIESANPQILDFYQKPIDLERVRQLIEFADKIGLYTIGNFIIGAPMETDETIRATFQYIQSSAFDRINIKTLDYMAGSPLYDSLPEHVRKNHRHLFACKENGLGDYTLSELRTIKKDFLDDFYHQRASKLESKIKRHGPPYD